MIHAGLYYPKDSLKARFCVAGRKLLYDYCAARGVAHRRIGKLVVACTEAEAASLRTVMGRAAANGVDDLAWIGGNEARAMEPELSCLAAFHSPSTGIIDSHGLMLAYEADAEAAGATIVLRAPVAGAEVLGHGFRLSVGGEEPMALDCAILVNSAGLEAPALARRIVGLPPETVPRDYYCRGVYFTLSGRAPFRRLVYPVPEAAGLGVHLTLDLAGQARFGPDTEWIDGIDYPVDRARGERFYAAIRSYWPGLKDGALQPGYAGIRPKINGPREPSADFVVSGAGGARRARPRQSLRHRVAGPHRVAAARRPRRGAARGGRALGSDAPCARRACPSREAGAPSRPSRGTGDCHVVRRSTYRHRHHRHRRHAAAGRHAETIPAARRRAGCHAAAAGCDRRPALTHKANPHG